jgi:hypothetical protein
MADLYDSLAVIESGNRNIYSEVDPDVSGPGTRSQGYFQINTPTWREFASPDIVRQYPNAMSAPYSVQKQVVSNIPLSRFGSRTQRMLRAQYGPLNLRSSIGVLAGGAPVGRFRTASIGSAPSMSAPARKANPNLNPELMGMINKFRNITYDDFAKQNPEAAAMVPRSLFAKFQDGSATVGDVKAPLAAVLAAKFPNWKTEFPDVMAQIREPDSAAVTSTAGLRNAAMNSPANAGKAARAAHTQHLADIAAGTQAPSFAGGTSWNDVPHPGNYTDSQGRPVLSTDGAHDGHTRDLQNKLLGAMPWLGEKFVSGKYDDTTAGAVMALQEEANKHDPYHKIRVDGIVGPQTWALMDRISAGPTQFGPYMSSLSDKVQKAVAPPAPPLPLTPAAIKAGIPESVYKSTNYMTPLITSAAGAGGQTAPPKQPSLGMVSPGGAPFNVGAGIQPGGEVAPAFAPPRIGQPARSSPVKPGKDFVDTSGGGGVSLNPPNMPFSPAGGAAAARDGPSVSNPMVSPPPGPMQSRPSIQAMQAAQAAAAANQGKLAQQTAQSAMGGMGQGGNFFSMLANTGFDPSQFGMGQ